MNKEIVAARSMVNPRAMARAVWFCQASLLLGVGVIGLQDPSISPSLPTRRKRTRWIRDSVQTQALCEHSYFNLAMKPIFGVRRR